jgi:hypothetical protein
MAALAQGAAVQQGVVGSRNGNYGIFARISPAWRTWSARGV